MQTRGMDAETGLGLAGIDHLRQSIRDILTTPVGTRVMRRDYGSRLPRLVDAPMTQGTILDIVAATAEALATWEPRLDIQEVRIVSAAPGRIAIEIDAIYLPERRPLTIDDIRVAA